MMLVLALETCGSSETPGVSYSCVTLRGGEEGDVFWFERGNWWYRGCSEGMTQ